MAFALMTEQYSSWQCMHYTGKSVWTEYMYTNQCVIIWQLTKKELVFVNCWFSEGYPQINNPELSSVRHSWFTLVMFQMWKHQKKETKEEEEEIIAGCGYFGSIPNSLSYVYNMRDNSDVEPAKTANKLSTIFPCRHFSNKSWILFITSQSEQRRDVSSKGIPHL